MRAVRLVDQHASIGGVIEYHGLPPWRGDRLVIAEYTLPGRPRVRRLDQGVGQIAQQPFIVGELELRGAQADARRRLPAEPAMHIIIEEILAGAPEIAAATARECRAYQKQGENRRRDRKLSCCP